MKKKQSEKLIYNILLPLAGVVFFILVWGIAAIITGKEIILPTPIKVLESLGELFLDSSFYKAVGTTLLRSLESYFIAFVLAIILAVLSSLNRIVEKLLSPFIIITRAIPTMSVILLALIWLNSNLAPMFVAFLIIFPLLYTGIFDSIKRVDKGLVDMSKVYKVGKHNIISKLYIRETLPSVFTLMRSTLSFNLKLIIAGEVLAYTSLSMGRFMQRASAYLDTATLLAWTVAAIVIGYLLELFVIALKKIFVKWEV